MNYDCTLKMMRVDVLIAVKYYQISKVKLM